MGNGHDSRFTIQAKDIPLFVYFSQLVFTALISQVFTADVAKQVVMNIILIGLFLVWGFKRFHKDCWIIVLFVLVTFAASLYSHPEYSDLYKELVFRRVITATGGVFGYVVIRQYSSAEQIKRCLKAASIPLFLYYTYRLPQFIQSGRVESMNDAYGILIAAIASLMWFFNEKKKVWGVIGVIASIEVFIYGTRGAVLCILVFLIVYVVAIMLPKQRSAKRFGLLFLLILGSIILYVSYDTILLYIANKFSSVGVISRIAEQIASGTLSDTNGRNIIWGRVLGLINDGSFWGHGALADQYHLNYFSHNIALEILLTYGKALGTVLLAIVVGTIILMFAKCSDDDFRMLFVIFLCCSIPRLIVSNSFWFDQSFWMMLGLSTTYLQSLRREKRLEEFMVKEKYSESAGRINIQ